MSSSMAYFKRAIAHICGFPNSSRYHFSAESSKILTDLHLATYKSHETDNESDIWVEVSKHAMPTIEAMNKMRRCNDLTNVVRSLMYNIDFLDNGQAQLAVVAEIDKEAVSGSFRIDNCDQTKWTVIEAFMLSQTVPHLYKVRHKKIRFVQATICANL